MRGQLTQEIKDKAKEMLGINITIKQLRLIPYIQYLVVNGERIDRSKINAAEAEILTQWRLNGHIGGVIEMQVTVTKQFWDVMSEIMWLGYANK